VKKQVITLEQDRHLRLGMFVKVFDRLTALGFENGGGRVVLVFGEGKGTGSVIDSEGFHTSDDG
jgi:hypothetical protein